MTNRKITLIFVVLIISFYKLPIFCSKLVIGNSKDSSKTFDFNIGPYIFCTKDESYSDFQLYIGAGERIKGNRYAISKVTRSGFNPKDGFKFVPLCPEKVNLNNHHEMINPLLGARITHLGLIGEYPVVVKNNDTKVYITSSFYGTEKEEVSIFHSPTLNDSNKKPTSKIVKLTPIENVTLYGSYIAVAVKGNKSARFGETASGSGIALVYVNDEEKKVKKTNKKTNKEEEIKVKYADLRAINADPAEKPNKQIKRDNDEAKNKDNNKKEKVYIPIGENKAAPFDGTLDAIKINNNAEVISNIVDMHWDKRLKRLYIACSVRSGNASGSGARALVIGRISDNKLHLQPIVPNNAITGNNQIIATGTPNSNVSIHKILTMHTTTLLDYLIVVGGNGNGSEVGNKVYALPLVNRDKEVNKKSDTDLQHGTLAKFDQEPKCYYIQNFLRDRGKAFIQPAEFYQDLLTSDNQAAMVGFGDLPLNPNEKISNIFVVNDAVFVSIGNKYNGQTQPGIFQSQAIFDSKGRIFSWTKWARVGGTNKVIKGAGLDLAKGQFWYIVNNQKSSVETTVWGKNYSNGLLGGTKSSDRVGLMALLDRFFQVSQGGIYGLFDFSKNRIGFNNFSMLIATGLSKLALIETGSLKGDFYKPTKGDFATESASSLNGNMPTTSRNTKFTLISGGDLNSIGAISATEIATNKISNESWIFVGGVNGLAVLVDENGRNWRGQISSLNEIPSNCKFKKIGNYSLINKLQSDDQFLYVLTNTKLDRIKLSSLNFKTGDISVNTLADSKYLANMTFNDFGVSDKFALLATSGGLLRVGNYRDIRLCDLNNMEWTRVNVPESLQIISKLFFVSTTGNEKDFAFKGQVYVLSSYRSFNQARLNRFVVNLTADINEKTIEPLPDLFIKDKLSNYYDFGIFKDNIWTNGALFFSSCSKDVEFDLYLHILSPKISTGTRSFIVSNLPVNLDFTQNNNHNICQIGRMIQSSASGTLLIPGNFVLRDNE